MNTGTFQPANVVMTELIVQVSEIKNILILCFWKTFGNPFLFLNSELGKVQVHFFLYSLKYCSKT